MAKPVRKSSGSGRRVQGTGRGTSGVKRKRAAGRRRVANHKRNQNGSRIGREILFLVLLTFSLLMLISSFGLGGVAGRMLSSFIFGLFGFPAYAFPVLLVAGCLFVMSNHENRTAMKKFYSALGLYLFICSFFQLLMIGYDKHTLIRDLYFDSAESRLGGGLFGGIFVQLFGNAFGSVGAWILVAAFLILFTILLTQEPLFNLMHTRGKETWNRFRENRKQSREKRAERKMYRDLYEATEDELFDEDEDENHILTEETSPAAEKPENDTAEKTKGRRGILPAALKRSEAERTVMSAADHASDGEDDWLLPEDEEVVPFDEPTEVSVAPEPLTVPEEVSEPLTAPETSEPPAARNMPAPAAAKSGSGCRKSSGTPAEPLVVPEKSPAPDYVFPPLDLLKSGDRTRTGESRDTLRETAENLKQTLQNFGVEVKITNVSCGPTVTRYELHPRQGVKVSRILNLQDDIKLNLAAPDIRIEAPIPGKSAIGIEVPNKSNSTVMLRDLLETREYKNSSANLIFAVGKDIAGKPVVSNLAKMPHLLIAGATGSGKSVCINTLIVSMLYKSTPDEVQFIMIDPKMVELSVYNGIPHLLIPVVTDPKKAAGALNWAVSEMMDRYSRFNEAGVRNLKAYNERIEQMNLPEEERPKKMARLVIIVDELADLMMVAQHEVENAIVRLSQLARAAGIHLVIATQRPSVNVITGLIKANMPSRIALSVTSGVDSRTILDMNGAEKLLGKGDMLFYPQGYQKPARVQGAFVSDEEINGLVEFLKNENQGAGYDQEAEKKITEVSESASPLSSGDQSDDKDVYFEDAAKLIIEKNKASVSMLQRAFKIGFNRAARIMDQLAEAGIVGEEEGTKPRKILITKEEFAARGNDNHAEM